MTERELAVRALLRVRGEITGDGYDVSNFPSTLNRCLEAEIAHVPGWPRKIVLLYHGAYHVCRDELTPNGLDLWAWSELQDVGSLDERIAQAIWRLAEG